METNLTVLAEPDFEAYLAAHSSQVTPRDLRETVAKLPGFQHRFSHMALADLPRLSAQLDLLAKSLEAFASGINEDIPLLTAAETVVALGHVFRAADSDFLFAQLPISHESLGILGAVLQRNAAAFQRFAQAKGVTWEMLEPLLA